MEGRNISRVDSARASGSNIWRNNNMDVFSTSEREDDEDALKWAAIERLPTYLRIQRSILNNEDGKGREVDIKQLGLTERKILLERLVKIAEEDNERFLLKLRERMDRVGLDIPTIEVRFEHINVEAQVYVGGRALPSMLNFFANVLEDLFFLPKGFLNYLHIIPSPKKPLRILQNISGIIKPRRMTLLLGPPGSGKTTLLLALAGKLGKDLKHSGRVTYNGHELEEFVPQRTSAYISQYDNHIGEMTVRETLAFSARCQGVGQNYEILAELLRREKQAKIKPDPDIDSYMKAAALGRQRTSVVTDYILKILGLEVCADIMVGDGMIRGISGGQKKRVTTGDIKKGSMAILGQNLGEELASPFDRSKSHPNVLTTKKYGVNKKELLRACASREFLLMKRNSFVYIFKVTQLIYLAIITTTLFLRTKMHRDTVEDGGAYMGALFFAVTVAMFNGISELNMAIMKLPVFYKQRDLLFYPAWAYSLPPWILKIPITLIEVAIWEGISYYAIGFDPSLVRLLKQYLIILCINQMASSLFRLMAAFGRDVIVANTAGSFALLIVLVLGGFVISRENVHKWFLWGYWSSPLMYGQNAIAVNEFLGHSWRKVTPNSNETLGVLILKTRGFFPEAYWYWIGVGALIGYVFLYNFLFTLALQYLSPFRKDQASGLSQEKLLERNASTAEELIQLPKGNSSSETNIVEEANIPSRSFSGRISDDKASGSGRRGMVLPFQPLSLTFDEMKYSVDMPQEMKKQGVFEERLELLKGVSGVFRPGVLTALMGVSGAGKTTLMDVLAGRKTGGYIEGSITISGYPKRQETFARISGYCEQFDIHSPNVTVYESLLYSAWLRLPREVDRATRKMFIEEVMELVELNSIREALVGLPGENGLSTEQRKRLTIAVELVANPSIIFMDEPTSGLDARAAAIVMRTVRNTVNTGRTVVCTIHQPSIDIFDAFDELLLLKLGGEQIYAGPLGRHCSHLIQYFEAIQGVPKIKEGYNPATWMLEVTSAGTEASIKVNFTNVYRNSELYGRNKQLIQELSIPPQGSRDLHFDSQYSQTLVTQCKACLWKQHLSYWRNTSYTAVRLLFTMLIALLFGIIFWDIGLKRSKEQDLFNAMGSMYAAVTFIGVQNGASVQPIIAVERTVFYRERAAGMYSALPYALAQVIIELPHILVQALMYGIIVYAMMGFDWTTSKFLWYLFFMYFTFLYYTFYGMMTMAITPNAHVAAILSSAFYAIWSLFSGFVIPLSRIPIWWKWYYWICPVAWTLNGLVASQYGDNRDKLENGQRVEEFVKSYFGFEHDFLGVVASVVAGFSLLFAFIFAFGIKVLNFQKR
ncbi:ABC transporter G family member 39-like isoform X4 [Glycine soja]|uniref:ABC transporter G family member 39-like isoform X4 n=1 Tax=Glycine soja TaxID=3848 RepID=UPI0003DEA5F3|nr:ABC transporter G family member 39-like isoform X4 [Glycine soja]|eukprot:XP_006596117.1 ABC transporter G family member 39 isoform X4 [Glycine max]